MSKNEIQICRVIEYTTEYFCESYTANSHEMAYSFEKLFYSPKHAPLATHDAVLPAFMTAALTPATV